MRRRATAPPGGRARPSRVQFVRQYPTILRGPSGESYVARAYTDRQPGGLWEAWLVFFSHFSQEMPPAPDLDGRCWVSAWASWLVSGRPPAEKQNAAASRATALLAAGLLSLLATLR